LADFLSRGEPTCPDPYTLHKAHQFLTFLKHERGFAGATIVNRERSLKPFFDCLVAEDVPLSTVSPVAITKYFTGIRGGKLSKMKPVSARPAPIVIGNPAIRAASTANSQVFFST
jgi:hypothetical protein